MDNSVKIDTFPITEDMYQLKSINIINSNFLSLKKWHDEFDAFCKLNKDTNRTRLYLEDVTRIDTEDLKVNHIQSIDTYNPSGTTGEEVNRLFEISRDVFRYKGFVIDQDGMSIPNECIYNIKNEESLRILNDKLRNPGRYCNGLVLIVLNSSSLYASISLSDSKIIFLSQGDSAILMQHEGSWFCLGKS